MIAITFSQNCSYLSIFGCPYCSESGEDLEFNIEYNGWYGYSRDKDDIDNDRVKIRFCPFCGAELPDKKTLGQLIDVVRKKLKLP